MILAVPDLEEGSGAVYLLGAGRVYSLFPPTLSTLVRQGVLNATLYFQGAATYHKKPDKDEIRDRQDAVAE